LVVLLLDYVSGIRCVIEILQPLMNGAFVDYRVDCCHSYCGLSLYAYFGFSWMMVVYE
jgi:hypothetical protein